MSGEVVALGGSEECLLVLHLKIVGMWEIVENIPSIFRMCYLLFDEEKQGEVMHEQ